MANTSGINNQSVPKKDESSVCGVSPGQQTARELAGRTSMHGLTTPSRKPSRPVIRSRSPSPKALSLIVLIRKRAQPEAADSDGAKRILDQVREALHDVTEQASGRARELYNRGERYVRQAGEQYPEAERYIRAGERAVTQRVTENPLLALFMAGVAGYALAWLIHGKKGDRKPDVPDYARTHRGYASHRERQPA